MTASFESITRWILAVVLILATLERSDAQGWKKRPNDPFIVVDGVNNTNTDLLYLVWELDLDGVSKVQNVFFKRRSVTSDANVQETIIASSAEGNAFNVVSDYTNQYNALLPTTLELLNVRNNEEYRYFITVTYLDRNGIARESGDSVVLDVKVPAKITTAPEPTSPANPGQNVTLRCEGSGDPSPNITWTRVGATSNQLVNANGSLLHLVRVGLKDVGSYNCTVENGYGTESSVAFVRLACGNDRCNKTTVAIEIESLEWRDTFGERNTRDFNVLASNLTAAITSSYSRPQNEAVRPYDVIIREFRSGSVVATVDLEFRRGLSDPLAPLRNDMADGKLGIFRVNRNLIVNPTTPPPTSPTGTVTSVLPPDQGKRTSGLSDEAMWGIIGACIAVVLIVAIIILVCCLRRKKNPRGATKGRYSEADGYRMNKQPPSSGLGTASPAYVEARMYAPPSAPWRQDAQPQQLNYSEPTFDKSSSKSPPPRYGNETDYSEVSSEKRPPPAGGQQGEGGFELWC